MTDSIELVVHNTDRAVTLSPGQTLIAGRTSQSDLQLDDPSVSRRHCQITFEHGVLRVRDLQSANGTYINERPVTEGTARAGDLIRMGGAIVEIRDPAGALHRP